MVLKLYNAIKMSESSIQENQEVVTTMEEPRDGWLVDQSLWKLYTRFMNSFGTQLGKEARTILGIDMLEFEDAFNKLPQFEINVKGTNVVDGVLYDGLRYCWAPKWQYDMAFDDARAEALMRRIEAGLYFQRKWARSFPRNEVLNDFLNVMDYLIDHYFCDNWYFPDEIRHAFREAGKNLEFERETKRLLAYHEKKKNGKPIEDREANEKSRRERDEKQKRAIQEKKREENAALVKQMTKESRERWKNSPVVTVEKKKDDRFNNRFDTLKESYLFKE